MGLPIGDDNWHIRGRPTNAYAKQKQKHIVSTRYTLFEFGLTKGVDEIPDKMIFPSTLAPVPKMVDHIEWPKDEAKPNVWGKTGWKGIIRLNRMIFVNLRDVRLYGHRDLRDILEGPFAEENIDICNYIGNDSKVDSHRIYFTPTLYPPLKDINDRDRGRTFDKLLNDIKFASSQGGSPVFCNGGNNSEKIFCCINHRRTGANKCPFRFTVRWDNEGYYIHFQKQILKCLTNGCPWHLCNKC